MDEDTLIKVFGCHAKWLETGGLEGKQLVLENVSLSQPTKEQLLLLTDSVLKKL